MKVKVKTKAKPKAKVKAKVKVKAKAAKAAKAAKRKSPAKVSKKVSKKTGRKIAKKSARKIVKKLAAKPKAKSAIRKTVKRPAVKPVAASAPKPSYPALVEAVLTQLDDAKAEAIVTIDLNNKSSVADYMVVASGRSNRHVNAIADQIVGKLSAMGQKNIRIEGVPQCDWVLVDSGDVIVHIFRPEVRSFYNLEKLWSQAPSE